MKTCSRCHVERDVTEFYADARGRDGRRADCKPCVRLNVLARYHSGHQAENRARAKAWVASNPERARAFSRKYYETHREQVNARTRKNHVIRWATQRALEQDRHRRWRQESPRDVVRQRLDRRRAAKLGAPIRDFTRQQWKQIQLAYGMCCAYCGVRPKHLTQDHIIPLAKGGSHTASNIVPACQSCNSKKGTRVAPPFQPLLLLPPPLASTQKLTE